MTDQIRPSAEDDVGQLQGAARGLYEAELALHDAHQTHVDSWIAAAADRLHRAVVRYESTMASVAQVVR